MIDDDDDQDLVDELPARPRKEIAPEDLELLQLAARALGAEFEEVDGEGNGNLHFEDGTVVYAWNSLRDSLDAFDLGVDLNIELRYHLVGDVPGVTATCAADSRLPICREPWTPLANDKRAAARRAVTRAAAEIGRQHSS